MSRRRESFVHRAKNLIPLRDLLDFPIPHCSKCEQPMVRLGVKWVCKTDTMVDQVTFVDEMIPGIDGLELVRRPVVKKVSVGEMFPNRKFRRAA